MVAVGICSRVIARHISLPDAEDVFLAGLLHDIGIVLEDQYVHQQFCEILRQLDPDKPLVEQERQYLAFDHTTLGARVAEKWKFPQMVLNAIRYHHQSKSYQEQDRYVVRCVELANAICTGHGFYSVHRRMVDAVSPDELDLPLDAEAVEKIDASFHTDLEKSAELLNL
jgi:putative nucleotidyltransferase with HDIG domain